MFAEIGLRVNSSKCKCTKTSVHNRIDYLNVCIVKMSDVKNSIAHRLLELAHTYYERVI
jgi:hypothetical protein